jgi:hypothetical protein
MDELAANCNSGPLAATNAAKLAVAAKTSGKGLISLIKIRTNSVNAVEVLWVITDA